MTTSDTLTLLAIVTITVALPVLLVVLADIAKRHIAFKERKLELVAAEATAQVKQLEERMRVLESIATDKGVGVAHQIESLRSKPARITDKELIR